MCVSQKPDPAFLNRKLSLYLEGRGISLRNTYEVILGRAEQSTPEEHRVPCLNVEQNSRYFSRYYATIRSWKHMEDGFFVLWHEIVKSTEHCMLSFYWQTLSTWETSVLFSCSQGNEGPHFQCSAHSAAFLWVAGVPEVNGELLYQSSS